MASTSETYYYRVVATNGVSTTQGPTQAYTKLPIIANEQASGRTSTSATLEATINPLFVLKTKYVFEYATTERLLEEGKGTLIPGGAGELPEEEVNEGLPVGTELTGLRPGHTYYYRVAAENAVSKHSANANKGAPVDGTIETVTPYAAPTATTGAAQNITSSSATLYGEVNPEGAAATYRFAYISKAGFQAALEHGAANPSEPNYQQALEEGAASPYAEGETTASTSLAAGEATQAVGPVLASELLPGETYHYALVVTNQFGSQTIGADGTFTAASAVPPVAITGLASAVGQSTATLTGTVTTNGLQTSYSFEIATAPGASYSIVEQGSLGGVTTEAVAATLTGLQPATTYYYRITAVSVDGVSEGAVQSFATEGLPSLLTLPASPAVLPTVPNFNIPEEGAAQGLVKLTTAQKLSKALKACRKDKMKSKRTQCERAARKKYKVPARKPSAKK